MYKLYLVIWLAFIQLNVFAQAPNYEWAKSVGGANNELANSVATDASGNVYVTGNFASPSIVFGTTTLTNTSSPKLNMYLVKYDASGNVLWAKSAGGTDDDLGNAVATDAQGNVYVTGSYRSSSIVFGSLTLTHSAGASADVFIVKYNANGSALWAKKAGGSNNDEGYSVATDLTGNVYVVGKFAQDPIVFGGITLNNPGFVGNIFIVKYSATGTALWGKAIGGDGDDIPYDVTTDAAENVYLVGQYYSLTMIVDTDTLHNTPGVVGNPSDMFIIKYNETGGLLWAKSEGGNYSELPYSVITDAAGNVFVTGTYNTPHLVIGVDTMPNAYSGSYGIFLIKYFSNGAVNWAYGVRGASSNAGKSIATDAAGNVYITGDLSGNYLLLDADTIYINGSFDAHILSFDTYGSLLWGRTLGGSGYELGNGIATDAAGNIFVVGQYGSPTLDLSPTILTNNGASDLYIAKLSSLTSGIAAPLQNPISIFPNPFNLQTTITFKNEQNSSTLIISDLQGKVIASSIANGKQFVIEKGNMEAGLYFVSLITNDGAQITKKIVVQ
jgi:hypothetical protein